MNRPSLPPLIAATYETPFGALAVLTSADGVVRGSGFRPLADVAARMPRALASRGWEQGEQPHVAAAVAAWLEGDAGALMDVPAEQAGGPFMQRAWAATRQIPAGEVMTYQELAAEAGSPNAMRAAGTACSSNTLAPFVPCHRIVAAGNRLGGYGYGENEKLRMLEMEAVALGQELNVVVPEGVR